MKHVLPTCPIDHTPGGTTAVLHYDDYENLLFQIRGTKELVLFPPSDLENLYYVGRRKGKLKYEYPGKWLRYCGAASSSTTFRSGRRTWDICVEVRGPPLLLIRLLLWIHGWSGLWKAG